jgi:epoxide hydrolase 4
LAQQAKSVLSGNSNEEATRASAVRNLKAVDIDLHYREAGSGPLVLLLHGFPEFSYGWRRQNPVLAEAGFRVIAPDLRGYNKSPKPQGVTHYRIEAIVGDVVRLIEHAGEQNVVLVGHDWGGIIAWYTAMLHPKLVRRLVILNAPHPVAFRRELRRLSSQVLRSWYALFFQLPRIPEAVLRLRNFAVLRAAWRACGAGPEEMKRYFEAYSQPGALTAALNYYRALVRFGPPKPVPIEVPVLLIWGEKDRYLVPRLTEGLESWVPQLRVERLSDATHWLHHEKPEIISRLIAEFARER